MMRLFQVLLFFCLSSSLHAQFEETAYREGWDNVPPEVQKKGFWLQKTILTNMDDDEALEEVMLFGRDVGHYPQFDLFEVYYAIVDYYTKEVQYLSDKTYYTTSMDLVVEDRNKDGRSELYRKYFKDKKFSVDERGYNLSVTWCYDRIEWKPDSLRKNKS